MRFQCLVCLLLAGLAYGQAAQPATPPAAPPPAAGAKAEQSAAATDKAPEIKVGPDEPVITLKSFCADASQQGDACKTVITRAQFEKLAEAVQPGMSPAIRRQVATNYSRLLRMSTAAEKRGLDKGPTFEEKMKLARMQILSGELNNALQEEARKITDGDIEDYYKKNAPTYEQATLMRIYVPRVKQVVPAAAKPKAGAKPGVKATAKTSAPQPPTEAQQKAAEEAMKKVAADVRARAVEGEDPDKLQKEAYAASGLPGNPPSTKMEKVRRTALQNHQAVMDLKPGEVSEVISDPNSGYSIYKMVSKETLPLDTVKLEIRNVISGQRYRDTMQGFQGNLDLNDAYFGPARNPAMPPPPRGAKAPAQQAEDPD